MAEYRALFSIIDNRERADRPGISILINLEVVEVILKRIELALERVAVADRASR